MVAVDYGWNCDGSFRRRTEHIFRIFMGDALSNGVLAFSDDELVEYSRRGATPQIDTKL